jgi:hypothetical protein
MRHKEAKLSTSRVLREGGVDTLVSFILGTMVDRYGACVSRRCAKVSKRWGVQPTTSVVARQITVLVSTTNSVQSKARIDKLAGEQCSLSWIC